MAATILPKRNPEPLDVRDPRNYPTYLIGIAVETAVVLALMAIGFLVAFLGAILR